MGYDVSGLRRLAADSRAAGPRIAAASRVSAAENARDLGQTMRDLVPVASGALRDSVVDRVVGTAAEAEATIRYAGYVDEGTSDTAPQPFTQPTLDAVGAKATDRLELAAEKVIG